MEREVWGLALETCFVDTLPQKRTLTIHHTGSMNTKPDHIEPERASQKRSVIFIHPDLGIGGAERLIIDAAVGLQELGHKVTIFTSHCDPTHCFDEARDGTSICSQIMRRWGSSEAKWLT